eukprot:TRINITY_DN8257_c0_g1_i2.p1 TRINITY_DN8257_c0_g1~~TRINITY_DN8257_c0_g1_i2.p1  ORF type:complete len:184 (+),score=35.71 TRINITY_DN8257_c0_g1_i2:88-639(+)
MIRRPPRSTLSSSSAASDVYKRQYQRRVRGKCNHCNGVSCCLLFQHGSMSGYIHPEDDPDLADQEQRDALFADIKVSLGDDDAPSRVAPTSQRRCYLVPVWVSVTAWGLVVAGSGCLVAGVWWIAFHSDKLAGCVLVITAVLCLVPGIYQAQLLCGHAKPSAGETLRTHYRRTGLFDKSLFSF